MATGPPSLKERPTYADIEALPEHLVGEIIAGRLVAMPRPAPPHAFTTSALGHFVGGPFGFDAGGPGGWWIVDEPELHLGIDPDFEVVVSDLAGWRRERMTVLPSEAFFAMAPDWVCEVLSPSTEASDRVEKMPFYARARVAHAWLVNPVLQSVEVYRLDGETWRLVATHDGGARVRLEPFGAIELDLARLWATSRA